MGQRATSVAFVVTDGLIPGAGAFDGLAYGTLDESTGALSVYWRLGLSDGLRLTGPLAVDADSVGSGAGTYLEETPPSPVGVTPPPLASGTWTCLRR